MQWRIAWVWEETAAASSFTHLIKIVSSFLSKLLPRKQPPIPPAAGSSTRAAFPLLVSKSPCKKDLKFLHGHALPPNSGFRISLSLGDMSWM